MDGLGMTPETPSFLAGDARRHSIGGPGTSLSAPCGIPVRCTPLKPDRGAAPGGAALHMAAAEAADPSPSDDEDISDHAAARDGLDDAVSISELQSVYHLPSKEAARALNVSLSRLKRSCRAHNVLRWPHRKLSSLHNLRETIRSDRNMKITDKQKILEQITVEVAAVLANPDHSIDPRLDEIRQAKYKLKYYHKTKHTLGMASATAQRRRASASSSLDLPLSTSGGGGAVATAVPALVVHCRPAPPVAGVSRGQVGASGASPYPTQSQSLGMARAPSSAAFLPVVDAPAAAAAVATGVSGGPYDDGRMPAAPDAAAAAVIPWVGAGGGDAGRVGFGAHAAAPPPLLGRSSGDVAAGLGGGVASGGDVAMCVDGPAGAPSAGTGPLLDGGGGGGRGSFSGSAGRVSRAGSLAGPLTLPPLPPAAEASPGFGGGGGGGGLQDRLAPYTAAAGLPAQPAPGGHSPGGGGGRQHGAHRDPQHLYACYQPYPPPPPPQQQLLYPHPPYIQAPNQQQQQQQPTCQPPLRPWEQMPQSGARRTSFGITDETSGSGGMQQQPPLFVGMSPLAQQAQEAAAGAAVVPTEGAGRGGSGGRGGGDGFGHGVSYKSMWPQSGAVNGGAGSALSTRHSVDLGLARSLESAVGLGVGASMGNGAAADGSAGGGGVMVGSGGVAGGHFAAVAAAAATTSGGGGASGAGAGGGGGSSVDGGGSGRSAVPYSHGMVDTAFPPPRCSATGDHRPSNGSVPQQMPISRQASATPHRYSYGSACGGVVGGSYRGSGSGGTQSSSVGGGTGGGNLSTNGGTGASVMDGGRARIHSVDGSLLQLPAASLPVRHSYTSGTTVSYNVTWGAWPVPWPGPEVFAGGSQVADVGALLGLGRGPAPPSAPQRQLTAAATAAPSLSLELPYYYQRLETQLERHEQQFVRQVQLARRECEEQQHHHQEQQLQPMQLHQGRQAQGQQQQQQQRQQEQRFQLQRAQEQQQQMPRHYQWPQDTSPPEQGRPPYDPPNDPGVVVSTNSAQGATFDGAPPHQHFLPPHPCSHHSSHYSHNPQQYHLQEQQLRAQRRQHQQLGQQQNLQREPEQRPPLRPAAQTEELWFRAPRRGDGADDGAFAAAGQAPQQLRQPPLTQPPGSAAPSLQQSAAAVAMMPQPQRPDRLRRELMAPFVVSYGMQQPQPQWQRNQQPQQHQPPEQPPGAARVDFGGGDYGGGGSFDMLDMMAPCQGWELGGAGVAVREAVAGGQGPAGADTRVGVAGGGSHVASQRGRQQSRCQRPYVEGVGDVTLAFGHSQAAASAMVVATPMDEGNFVAAMDVSGGGDGDGADAAMADACLTNAGGGGEPGGGATGGSGAAASAGGGGEGMPQKTAALPSHPAAFAVTITTRASSCLMPPVARSGEPWDAGAADLQQQHAPREDVWRSHGSGDTRGIAGGGSNGVRDPAAAAALPYGDGGARDADGAWSPSPPPPLPQPPLPPGAAVAAAVAAAPPPASPPGAEAAFTIAGGSDSAAAAGATVAVAAAAAAAEPAEPDATAEAAAGAAAPPPSAHVAAAADPGTAAEEVAAATAATASDGAATAALHSSLDWFLAAQ